MKIAKNNFLDLPKFNLKEAQVIIVPFGFEATTTFGKGAKNGPAAIIKSSRQVELFDDELWQETYKKVKIMTAQEPKKKTRDLEGVIKEILENKKLPIILGGEHSITSFIINAYRKTVLENFSILQFDAHADLRDGYLGQKYSHAAAMRRCLDFKNINLVQIGIRNISNENDEMAFWKRNQGSPVNFAKAKHGARIKTFWAKDKKKWKIADIVKGLEKNVYITFDVDVFDSSIMPSTGTPEPGGLDWYEVLDVLRMVCAKRKIIGADFVELAPIKNFPAPDFLVAKLIYKTIGYIFRK
jgi:agmatinase